jgi:hypothetical protein
MGWVASPEFLIGISYLEGLLKATSESLFLSVWVDDKGMPPAA